MGPAFAGEVSRTGGEDRIDTALAIFTQNRAVFTSDTIVLAQSNGFADALTATPLATALKAPILTTGPDGLDPRVLAVLKEQGIRNVVIVGGEGALSAGTAAALVAAGMSTERIAGADRYETALKVADKIMAVTGATSVPVFVASGERFPDAMAAGAAAARVGGIVLLAPDKAHPATTAFLQSGKAKEVIAVGGPAGHALDGVEVPYVAVVGKDRYDTAAQLAQRYFPTPSSVVLASGEGYADGMTGGPLAALTGAPLQLTGSAQFASAVQRYLDAANPDVRVLGGPAAIPDRIVTAVTSVVDGPKAVPSPTTTPTSTPTFTPRPVPAPAPAPTADTFEWGDIPSEVYVAQGDSSSIVYGRYQPGAVVDVWIKRPGQTEFERRGPADDLFSAYSVDGRDDGTQVQFRATYRDRVYVSPTVTVHSVVASEVQTAMSLRVVSDPIVATTWSATATVEVTVEGIASAADGKVTLCYAALPGRACKLWESEPVRTRENTYIFELQPHIIDSYDVKVHFSPKDGRRYSKSDATSRGLVNVVRNPNSSLRGYSMSVTTAVQTTNELPPTFDVTVTDPTGRVVTSGVVAVLNRDQWMCWDMSGGGGWSCEAPRAYEGEFPRVRAVWSPNAEAFMESSQSEFVQSEDVAVQITAP